VLTPAKNEKKREFMGPKASAINPENTRPIPRVKLETIRGIEGARESGSSSGH